jgi:hypothetical protein
MGKQASCNSGELLRSQGEVRFGASRLLLLVNVVKLRWLISRERQNMVSCHMMVSRFERAFPESTCLFLTSKLQNTKYAIHMLPTMLSGFVL